MLIYIYFTGEQKYFWCLKLAFVIPWRNFYYRLSICLWEQSRPELSPTLCVQCRDRHSGCEGWINLSFVIIMWKAWWFFSLHCEKGNSVCSHQQPADRKVDKATLMLLKFRLNIVWFVIVMMNRNKKKKFLLQGKEMEFFGVCVLECQSSALDFLVTSHSTVVINNLYEICISDFT